MGNDVYSAIVSNLKEMARTLPSGVRPGRSGPNTISWLGWQPPAHRPEARGEHVRLTYSLKDNHVRCQLRVQIHSNWTFESIGPSAETDHNLDA